MAILVEDVEKTVTESAETIKEKLKKAFNVKGKFIGIILIILFAAGGFTFGRYYPTNNTVSEITSNVAKQYEKELKANKEIIAGLEKELKIADENYMILSNKIKDLKVSYENVKEPKNIAEIKDRFIKLGFPPL